ncbi:hypothetical protein TWF694_005991 [Orbilia ellipsospora]|uniref:C2H2-type domain-containing protein n=1 Tax=Orbilia ellipsospora TaxID=2528407 RepID=A0AAV9WSI7_9PEZI
MSGGTLFGDTGKQDVEDMDLGLPQDLLWSNHLTAVNTETPPATASISPFSVNESFNQDSSLQMTDNETYESIAPYANSQDYGYVSVQQGKEAAVPQGADIRSERTPIHKSAKSFRCSRCKRAFGRSDNLKRHESRCLKNNNFGKDATEVYKKDSNEANSVLKRGPRVSMRDLRLKTKEGFFEERTSKLRWLYVLLQVHFFHERKFREKSDSPVSSCTIAAENLSGTESTSIKDLKALPEGSSSREGASPQSNLHWVQRERKRKDRDEDEEDRGDDGRLPPSKCNGGSDRDASFKWFACPYAKGDLTGHPTCLLISRKDLAGVK